MQLLPHYTRHGLEFLLGVEVLEFSVSLNHFAQSSQHTLVFRIETRHAVGGEQMAFRRVLADPIAVTERSGCFSLGINDRSFGRGNVAAMPPTLLQGSYSCFRETCGQIAAKMFANLAKRQLERSRRCCGSRQRMCSRRSPWKSGSCRRPVGRDRGLGNN